MTRISDQTLDEVSALAKLRLNVEEREQARRELERMLDYVDVLKELDTDGVEPMPQTLSAVNVFREDVVTNESGQRATLQNAPERKGAVFCVPRTVE